MPVTKSAAKRVRQELKRHKVNLKIKNNMKRDIKALLDAIAENNPKAVKENMPKAQSSIDRAAKGGVIHKNKASRQKSRLTKLAKKPVAKPATKPKATVAKTKSPAKAKTTAKKTSNKK